MPSARNKIDNKSDDQFIMMKVYIYDKKKEMKETDAKLDKIKKWTKTIMDKPDNSSPKKVKNNPQDYTTVVHTNRKVSPLEGEQYKEIRGILTLKHDISSPKFYKIILKADLKWDSALDLKKFHNQVKIFLNTATKLQ